MIPSFCLTRLNHRSNTMTCKTPCDNCSCESNSPYESDYQEIDSCPMATEQIRFFKELEAEKAD